MKKYKVSIGDEVFELGSADLNDFDVQKHQERYHILENQQSFKAKILNISKKNISIEVNGNPYQCLIKDGLDVLIDDLGLAAVNKTVSKDVVAPMPGLVLEIAKKEGDTIKEGETLLILEAMKMENALKASADGIIKKINTKKAETVDKGFVIMEIE